ncbi:copper resistance CopC family protein [Methylocystis echinoides]|uniref:copper resistance CopC family protein n=1 Tax=Methylocystis echinoides TaxID=29468 RepID=UPI003440EBF1
MKSVLTGALAALALTALAVPVSAHAVLVDSYPANKQQVLKPLHTIRLVFSGKADALYSTVKLKDNKGAVIAEKTQKEPSRELTLPTPSLMPGDYHIVYRVLSVDGDVVEGKLDFSIFGLEA